VHPYTHERRTWSKALDATVGAWENAYAREAPPREVLAFSMLGDGRDEPVVPQCEHCGKEIMGKQVNARFCSKACRQRANYEQQHDVGLSVQYLLM